MKQLTFPILEPRDRCFFIIVVDVVHVVDVLDVADCPSGAPILNEMRHKISCF